MAAQKELDVSRVNLEDCRIWASLKEQRFLVRKEDVCKTVFNLALKESNKEKTENMSSINMATQVPTMHGM